MRKIEETWTLPISALEIMLALSVILWGAWWLSPGHDFPLISAPFQALLKLASESEWSVASLLIGCCYMGMCLWLSFPYRGYGLIVGATWAVFMWTYNAAAFFRLAPQTTAAPACTALAMAGCWALSRRISDLILEWRTRRNEGLDE